MAGPACSVLFPTPVPADEIIQELVRLKCLTSSHTGNRSLSVGNTHPIGGTYQGGGRPIIWDREIRDAGELALLAQVLPVAPQGEVGLAAMCNEAIDHRVLGELALWVAEKTNGFVDLGGCVQAPSAGIPGRIARIPYETAAGSICGYMVMDRVAFRYWLSCASFRMVK